MTRNRYWNRLLWACAILLVLFEVSCTRSSLPVQYHNLTPLALDAAPQAESLSTILVGPVRISTFLDQGPMVKQGSTYSANLIEQHHWAGDLDEMLSRTIIQNLILALGHETVFSYPDTSSRDGIRLAVDFFHFEKDVTGDALLEARWKIFNNSKQTILHSATSRQSITPVDAGYDALAEGLSRGLAELCREMAASLVLVQDHLQKKQRIEP